MLNDDLLALSNPETFQDQDRIHSIFRQLRRDNPIACCPEIWGRSFWALTRKEALYLSFGNGQYLCRH